MITSANTFTMSMVDSEALIQNSYFLEDYHPETIRRQTVKGEIKTIVMQILHKRNAAGVPVRNGSQ